METGELLQELLRLAREAEIPVRLVGGLEGAETSALCRVRGQAWIVLSRADPPEAQIAVLARGLRTAAPGWLEERYLPPAVRARLEEA